MSAALIRSGVNADLNADLNDAQRAAVEHGVGDPDGPAPLIVIAGAGAGKTNMLAHRVAHLILNGADPKRIMLATFSRRAAAELKDEALFVGQGRKFQVWAPSRFAAHLEEARARARRIRREIAAPAATDARE